MPRISSIIVTFLLFIIAFSSCSIHVNVLPNPPVYLKEKIPLDVGLYIDPQQLNYVYTQRGFCLLGVANKWQVDVGTALAFSAESTFNRMFVSVEKIKSIENTTNKNLILVFIPEIKEFSISQNITARLLLHCSLMNMKGEIIYEKTVPAYGQSEAGMAFIGGVFIGQDVLSSTTGTAFETAFAFLAEDIMNKVDFTPYIGSDANFPK